MDTPIIRAIDDILSWSSPGQDWLKRAGPIAAEMNRQSPYDFVAASPLNPPEGNPVSIPYAGGSTEAPASLSEREG